MPRHVTRSVKERYRETRDGDHIQAHNSRERERKRGGWSEGGQLRV